MTGIDHSLGHNYGHGEWSAEVCLASNFWRTPGSLICSEHLSVVVWVTCSRGRVLHLSVWYRPLAPPCLPVTGLQVGEAEVAVDKFPGAASHGAGR